MMHRLAILLFAATAATFACGPSAKDVKTARSVGYQTDFAIVWNETMAAVRSKYPTIFFEDAVKGRIETQWHLVEKVRQSDFEEPDKPPRMGETLGGMPSHGARLFRLFVQITGGPPWRITVDGEAAEYKPGMPRLVPYPHGAADEPTWVKPRIDAMYVDIYQRLKRYAVKLQDAPSLAARRRDTARWENLPSDAGEAAAGVHAAARARDAAQLRPFLADPFASSAGELPADDVVKLWGADPTPLAELARALEAGCDYDQVAARASCPRGARAGPRAVLARDAAGRWKLVRFSDE